MDVTNQATWEDAHAPEPEPDYQAMPDPKMYILADVYELLQEVRELGSDPPRGYTTQETLDRLTEVLHDLARDADSIQQELAVEFEGVLGIVEARMHAELEDED